MIELDVAAALKGNRKSHQPMEKISAIVAEYSMSALHAKTAFDGSPFAFNSRQGHVDRLKKECDAMRPGKALIVTLPDPAGIVQELAFLMKHTADSFIKRRPDDKRKAAASAAIDQIETAVCLGAEEAEIAGAEDIAIQRIADDPFGHWMSNTTRAKIEKIRNVESKELRRASDLAWAKYAVKFNDDQRKAWLKSFEKQLNEFDRTQIAPLADAHVSWMRSQILALYFECNYDQNNLEAGKVYTTVLSHCVLATQDKKACSDLYEEWLKGNIDDSKNLMLRAFLLNQAPIIEAVKNATSVSVDPRQIPWDNLFGAHDAAIGRLNQAAQDVVAKFMLQCSGPIARGFNKILDGSPAFRELIMASGLISGHPVVVCEIKGSRKMFVEKLVRELMLSNSNQARPGDMKRAVKAELRRLQMHGMRLEGETRKRWIVVADKNLIKNMPTNLSPQQQATWLAKSVRTVESLDQTNLERWRSVVHHAGPKVVIGLIQLICLTKVWADEEKSLSHEQKDASRRLYTGIAAFISTTADAIGGFLESRAALGLRFGQGVMAKTGVFLQSAAKIGGLCAGIAMAVWDGTKASEAKAEKQMGLAWLYAGSATIGFSLTILLLYPAMLGVAAIPVIGVLIVLALVIGIIIDREKDNPIQDWLERCPWGMLEGQRYADMETEQSQLAQALK